MLALLAAGPELPSVLVLAAKKCLSHSLGVFSDSQMCHMDQEADLCIYIKLARVEVVVLRAAIIFTWELGLQIQFKRTTMALVF